jgi:hypothetical protein
MTYNSKTRQDQRENASPDATEATRRQLVAEINAGPGGRAALTEEHGRVWDTVELRDEFEVLGFLAPFVVVRRRQDGMRGTLRFQHSPRFYFSFVPDRE